MRKILLVVLCAVMVFGTSTVFASDGVVDNLINKEVVVKKTDKEAEELNLKRLKDNAEYHVSRFEENPTDETLATNAQASINALPEDERADFQARYDAAVAEVALAEAQEAVEAVEAKNPIAANSYAISEAKGLSDKATEAVEALEDSEEKTALEKRIKAQQALINAANLQRLKDNAKYHVSKFEENPTDETLKNTAQKAIKALPENEREPYQERYDVVVADVKAEEEATIALEVAQKAVKEADVAPLASASQIDIAQGLLNDAKTLVDVLPVSKDKEALVQDVARIQYEIDSSRQRLIDNAEYHVSRFEANPTDETLKNIAQEAIRVLPKNERVYFQTRYDKVATEKIEEITRKTFYTFQIGNEFYTYRNADGNVTRFLMDVKPYILNDRTMLPIRYTAYTLGLQVEYDDTTRTAVFFDGDTVVTINIDSNEVKLNGSVAKLDAPVQNIDGRLMTPVSQIAKLFGRTNGDWNDGVVQDIEWLNQYRLVFIFD